MQQPEAGNAVTRIFDKPQQRQHVLDVRGIKKLQAAELHERDIATGQFDFKRAPVARRRNKQGCSFSSVADSRFSRIRSTMKRAWSASSRTVTSCGLAPGGRFVPGVLGKRSLARPMTPLAAARIVCVER